MGVIFAVIGGFLLFGIIVVAFAGIAEFFGL
jgi:hypothetical protein